MTWPWTVHKSYRRAGLDSDISSLWTLSVSQIASCPRAAGDGGSRQDNGPMGTVRSQGHENGGENNSTEFASTSSGVRHHAFQSGLIQDSKALGKNSSDLNLLSENVPRVDAESNQTTIDKFNNALLMAALGYRC